MKKIERLAIVVIILMVVSVFASFFADVKTIQWLGVKSAEQIQLRAKIWASLRVLVLGLVHAGVGVWLFFLAKKSNAAKWIWGLFGLVFDLIAVVLYYLIEIHTLLRVQREGPAATQDET